MIAKVNGQAVYINTGTFPDEDAIDIHSETHLPDEAIDQVLVIQAAKAIGGKVPDTWVDANISAIIDDQFAGNQSDFERKVISHGYTMPRWRELVRDRNLYIGMKSHIKRMHNEDNRNPDFNDWLAALHAKAQIDLVKAEQDAAANP